jgi:hypothetical protein
MLPCAPSPYPGFRWNDQPSGNASDSWHPADVRPLWNRYERNIRPKAPNRSFAIASPSGRRRLRPAHWRIQGPERDQRPEPTRNDRHVGADGDLRLPHSIPDSALSATQGCAFVTIESSCRTLESPAAAVR